MVINCRPEINKTWCFPVCFEIQVYFSLVSRQKDTQQILTELHVKSSTCGIKKHYFSKMFVGSKFDYIYYNIQGVLGGRDKTSGECSLC